MLKIKVKSTFERYENISIISGHLIMVPKNSFVLKVHLHSIRYFSFISGELDIVNTWPGK